jgi:autotransporter passenger strand-loop-strand repeat protein
MATIEVGSGVISSGLTLAAGDSIRILSGGTALDTGLGGGASAEVFGGGLASGLSVGGPGAVDLVLSGGTAMAVVLAGGGAQSVGSGATSLATTIDASGYDVIVSSAFAADTVVNASGLEILSGGVTAGTVVQSGGLEWIEAGQTTSTILQGGLEILAFGGVAQGTMVGSGAAQHVSAGGLASGTVVATGGTELVAGGPHGSGQSPPSYASGMTVSTVLQSGGTEVVSVGGVAQGTVLGSGGVLILLPGGMATSTQFAGGTQIDTGVVLYSPAAGFTALPGPAQGLTVAAGGTDLLLAGGTAVGTVLGIAATEMVFAGGTASATRVTALGSEIVSSGGTARDPVISDGGTAFLYSGGVTLDATVSSGGSALVFGGATALGGMVDSGAVEFLYSGASGSGTVVDAGGVVFVYGGASLTAPTVESGGVIVLLPGGAIVSPSLSGGEILSSGVALYQAGSGVTDEGLVASGLTVGVGGAEYVLQGGTAISSVIDAGAAYVFGTASGMAINNGAEAFIQGSATGTVISNGYEFVQGGGTVVDTALYSAGFERIEAGGIASGTYVGSDAVQFVSSGGTASFATVSSGGLQYSATSAVIISTTVLSGTSGAPVTSSGGSILSGGSAGPVTNPAPTAGMPSWNTFQGNESYAIPYTNNPFGTQTSAIPQILVTIGSGLSTLTQSANLDTGSRGIIVSAAAFPDIAQGPNDPSGTIFYWSSGNKYVGFWHDMTVTFPDATGTAVSGPATATVPVFFVQYEVSLAGNWPEGYVPTTTEQVPPASRGIMNFGIGFDRTGEGTTPENDAANQDYNAFLNLTQMQAGTMTAGFILTSSGLQLGLTAANTAPDNGNSYAFEKLLPTGFATLPGSPPDWQAPTGSVTYGGVTYATGQAVIDTGIKNALLSLPGAPVSGTVTDGQSLTANLLGGTGAASYTVTVGETADPLTPNPDIAWAAVQPGNQALSENQNQTTLLNTGQNAINGFNYLYDAADGYLGLQANGSGDGDVTVNPETVYQGTTDLPDGFDSLYPVQLVDAFDTAASVGFVTSGTATVSGAITGGFDTITGTAVPITLAIGDGDIHLTGAGSYAAAVITGGATLDDGNATAAGGAAIIFGAGGGTLAIDAGIQPSETLSGLGLGDGIDARGIAGASATVTGDSISVLGAGGTLTLRLDAPFVGTILTGPDAGGTGTLLTIACFAAGTHIATPGGAVAVEALRAGDLVTTETGAALPVVWCGHRQVDCRRHPSPAAVRPVRIAAHAFGPGRPRRPLLLSPDHAIFAEGVLIPVKHLIDGRSIRQIDVPRVTYHHIELPRHAVVLAEALPVESYLDTGDRLAFAGDLTDLHPAWGSEARDVALIFEAIGYAPLRVTGPEVERVRARLRSQVMPLEAILPWMERRA